MIKCIDDVITYAKQRGPKTLAVACAQDDDVLKAVETARQSQIAEAILVGDAAQIAEKAKLVGVDLANYQIIDIKDMAEAALKAVELVSSGQADMLMKGLVDTAIILKAVLNKEIGLRTGNPLSHIALFDVPKYHKMFVLTDAAMNIAPDLETKKQIIENALLVTRALDIEMPKVGVLCAKEKVNPKMPATEDAAGLVKLNQTGQLANCLVGGPFALDNAISKEAAKLKKIDHPAAGDCDILLCPDIEAGNIFYKALSFLTDARNAGAIVGAKAPIVLTSRADSDDVKLNSIALAVLMAAK
ncbi:MAG: phosphate butyryltransferase [Clostridiales bacterium]|nr:MAG: phosphate butyryltransferase [Clostridiales bacterium]